MLINLIQKKNIKRNKDMENEQEILYKILSMNKKFDRKLCRNIKFQDKSFEESFLTDRNKVAYRRLNILFNSILFIGYLHSCINFFFGIDNCILYVMHIIFFLVFLILIFISNKIKSLSLKRLLEISQIILLNIHVIIKEILIAYYYDISHSESNSDKNINILSSLSDCEQIRLYVSNNIIEVFNQIHLNSIIITSLLIISAKKIHIFVFIFYMLNILIISSIKYYKLPTLYSGFNIFFEMFLNIMILTFVFIIKNNWETKLREIFIEKYKFEKLFLYTHDFIFGLNGYQLNFKDNYLLCYDKKFYKFLSDNLTCSNSQHNIFRLSDLKNDLNKKNTFLLDMEKSQQQSFIKQNKYSNKEIDKNLDAINFAINEFNPITYFLKQLKGYEVHENMEKRLNKKIKKFNAEFYEIQKNNDSNKMSPKEPESVIPIKIKELNFNNLNLKSSKKFLQTENLKIKKNEINLFDQLILFLKQDDIFETNKENIYLGVFAFDPEKNKENNFETLVNKMKNKVVKPQSEKKYDDEHNIQKSSKLTSKYNIDNSMSSHHNNNKDVYNFCQINEDENNRSKKTHFKNKKELKSKKNKHKDHVKIKNMSQENSHFLKEDNKNNNLFGEKTCFIGKNFQRLESKQHLKGILNNSEFVNILNNKTNLQILIIR